MKKLVALLLLIGSPAFPATTNYYVSFANGSDANNGLGPDASHASNKPFKTLQKALGTNMGSGDTVYVSPGVQRELVTCRVQYTANTFVKGDPRNVQGFKDGSGILVTPQQVRVTPFTNDAVAAVAGSTMTLNGMDYIWFENLLFQKGTLACFTGAATSTNITLTNCVFIGTGSSATLLVSLTAGFGIPLNLNVDNCIFVNTASSGGGCIDLVHTSGTGSDWDIKANIRNSLILSHQIGLSLSKGGSSANVGSGVCITNCTFFTGANTGFLSLNSSTNNFTNFVYGCTIFANTGIFGGVTNQTVEDYNYIFGGTPLNTVVLGAHTHTNDYSYHMEVGQSKLFGLGIRPMLSPNFDSPFIGSANNYVPVDIYSTARPSTNANGAIQFYNPPSFSSTFGAP